MKRALSLLLLVALLLGGTAMAEITYPLEVEDNNLTFWCPIQPVASKYMASYNDHIIYTKVSENTGMAVDFINCAPADAATQLGLIVAGGDMPDILQVRGLYPGGPAAGVSEGIFLDLTPYLEEYAPDYYAALRSNDLCYRLCTSEDGRVFAFYNLKKTFPAFNRLNYLQEVMDEYDLAVPITLDDYEAQFEVLKQNGIAGLLLAQNGRSDILMWPFGITNGWGLDLEGNVEYGQATEAFRDYLTLMNKWYEAGYIYKDFMSQMNDTERQALWTNKVIGVYQHAVDLANSVAVTNGYECAPLPYVRKEAGQPLHFEVTYVDYAPEENFGDTVIAADSKKIEAAISYMNYYYTPEGADLANWGIEGLHYTVQPDGSKAFTDEILNNPNMPLGDVQMNYKIHLTAKLSEPDVVCNPNVIANEVALAKRMEYAYDDTIDNAQVLPKFPLAAEVSEERSRIMVDIDTYIDEMTLKFITGVTPLTEFDAFLEQVNKMGLQDAIDMTQTAYEAFMSKPGLE